jgi:hypothetical protein
MKTNNKKALYQPWGEEEFRADLDVQAMGHMERWMYRTLCQAAFVSSTRPDLPDDDGQLWKMAGCETSKQWDKHKSAVRAMFTPSVEDGIPVLYRKRIRDDWNRIAEKRDQLAANGRKGGEAKAAKEEVKEVSKGSKEVKEVDCHTNATQLLGKSLANAKQMPETSGQANNKTNNLLKIVESAASDASEGKAVFYKTNKDIIKTILEELGPDPEVLRTAVYNGVKNLDEFNIQRAGGVIAGGLNGWISAQEKNLNKADRQNALREASKSRLTDAQLPDFIAQRTAEHRAERLGSSSSNILDDGFPQ